MFNFNRQPQDPVWMVVRVTNNPGEAHIIAGRLQSEGLSAWVHQEPFGSAMGITFGKLGEIKVVVRTEDYERALEILSADDFNALPEDTEQRVFDEDDDIPYLDEDDE